MKGTTQPCTVSALSLTFWDLFNWISFFNSNELQTAAVDDVPLKSNFNVFCVIKCIYCAKTWRYLTIFALKTTPEEDCEPLSNNSEW